MRVAIYAIALNEEALVERWAASAKGADIIILGDTGSTDRTVEVAKSMGVAVVDASVSPWRFDTARNLTLDAIPEDIDYCIALDLDEVILPGWRDALEEAHKKGLTKPAYKFVFDWLEDGSENLVYEAHKIHARHGFEWRLPIHEALFCINGSEVREFVSGLEIHHFQEKVNKPHRSNSALDLLELAVGENPNNLCTLYCYARELYRTNRWDEAYPLFLRCLEILPDQGDPDADRVLRFLAHIDEPNRAFWIERACANCPDKREPWATAAEYYFFERDWSACLAAAEQAFVITSTPWGYEREPFAWGYQIYEFAALSAYELNLNKKGDYYADITREMFNQKEQSIGSLC